MFEITGKILFDPVAEKTKFNEGWAIVTFDCDICKYYQWFLNQRFNIKLSASVWGPHVSFIRGEESSNWSELKQKYDGTEITISLDPAMKTNGRHWWLRAECSALKDMRVEMGLVRDNPVGLHLTVGHVLPNYIEHSVYIWKTCLLFDL